MKIDPDRIRERLVALGHDPADGGQTWLARQVDMKPQGIQSIMAGDVARPRKLHEIALALQTTEEYRLGGPVDFNDIHGPSIDNVVRLAQQFAQLAKAPRAVQAQVADYIDSRLRAVHSKSREMATKQDS